MRLIRDLLAAARDARRPAISFEFFPTKTEEGERTLLEKTIPALMQLRPDFCSVTYDLSALGHDRDLMTICVPAP